MFDEFFFIALRNFWRNWKKSLHFAVRCVPQECLIASSVFECKLAARFVGFFLFQGPFILLVRPQDFFKIVMFCEYKTGWSFHFNGWERKKV